MRLTLSKDLAPLRRQAIDEIDAAAEAARLRHMTPGAAQAMVYARKRSEAEAAGGPILAAEADARNMTVAELAAEVIRRADETDRLLGRIEACRMTARRSIAEAGTPQAVVEATESCLKALARLVTP